LALQLLYSPASPFARKVRVVILETGLGPKVEVLTIQTSPIAQDPTLTRTNPLGKIPALIRDDGPAIYDSRVITRYLDAIGSGGLYPAARIWEVLTLEATADGIMEAALAITYERRMRTEETRSEPLMESQRQRIRRALDVLGERWMSHLGGRFDIGHIAVGCALGYLDLRHPDLDWRAGRDALAAWEARLSTRESMLATVPQG
jgi:glutathione S-transferase